MQIIEPEYIPEYIIYWLTKGDFTANELNSKIPYHKENIMNHIRKFRKQGIIGAEKRGETQALTYFKIKVKK